LVIIPAYYSGVAERGEPDRVMTPLEAERERLERLRASMEETLRTSRVIIEESRALLAALPRYRTTSGN
jgi:hypothetical protein